MVIEFSDKKIFSTAGRSFGPEKSNGPINGPENPQLLELLASLIIRIVE